MTEPICPACNGSGVIEVYIGPGEKELCDFYFIDVQQCPTCYGAGIATDDEVREFVNFMKEE